MALLIFIASLLGAMAIGVPIAYALMLTGISLMLYLDFFDAQIVAQNLLNGADSFPLMAIPFFLLAGEVMNAGGLSRRIVNLALKLVGHRKGGLGYVAILAGCILASLSGSAAADAAALAAILVPMMARAGHNRARAGGLVASSGVIALIIPPSIGFILFGVVGGVSITRLFLHGIVPGLLMAVSIATAWWFISQKEDTTPSPKAEKGEVLIALRDSFWALLLPVIIIVGLRFGVFTPTEAGVVAAVYALFVAVVIYRELKLHQLYKVFLNAACLTALVMFLVAAAMVSGWMITISGLPVQIVQIIQPFIDNPILLMLVIIALVLLIGTAMDMVPIILILVPVLMPAVRAAGIDPVYFGVVFMTACAISLLTPPVGTVLSVVAGVSNVSIWNMIKGVTPFLIALLGVLLLMILFPAIITVPGSFLVGG